MDAENAGGVGVIGSDEGNDENSGQGAEIGAAEPYARADRLREQYAEILEHLGGPAKNSAPR